MKQENVVFLKRSSFRTSRPPMCSSALARRRHRNTNTLSSTETTVHLHRGYCCCIILYIYMYEFRGVLFSKLSRVLRRKWPREEGVLLRPFSSEGCGVDPPPPPTTSLSPCIPLQNPNKYSLKNKGKLVPKK